jgi:hypothetical protein
MKGSTINTYNKDAFQEGWFDQAVSLTFAQANFSSIGFLCKKPT